MTCDLHAMLKQKVSKAGQFCLENGSKLVLKTGHACLKNRQHLMMTMPALIGRESHLSFIDASDHFCRNRSRKPVL